MDDTAAADPQRSALDDILAAGRVALGEQHLSARQRDKRLLVEEREDIAVCGGGRNVFRRLAACGGNTKPPPRGGAGVADHCPALNVKRLRRFRAAVDRDNAACRITPPGS